MSTDRTQRVIVRTTAGLALLLMLALPLSVIPTVWAWDWRWLLTGLVLGAVGLAFGVLVRTGARK